MKIGAAMAAAANRITAANSPAMLKITSERQYWARLMRRLAPNRVSFHVPLHTKAPANRHPGMCLALKTNSGSRQTKRLNRSEA
jgi:hypothetical protein